MDDALTRDELLALEEIKRGLAAGRPSACVARNSKRLAGLKYIARNKKGGLELTAKAQQLLFIRACIAGLHALQADPAAKLPADVLAFLERKGHIQREADSATYVLTSKGHESLAAQGSGAL